MAVKLTDLKCWDFPTCPQATCPMSSAIFHTRIVVVVTRHDWVKKWGAIPIEALTHGKGLPNGDGRG